MGSIALLPVENRLCEGAGFLLATRGGRRAGGRGLVLHVARTEGPGPARVGLIVSRAVGGSVVRNRVKRRLRHLLRSRIAALPVGAVVAVRALPASASMASVELGAELDRCLSRVGVSVSSTTSTSSAVNPSTETVVR